VATAADELVHVWDVATGASLIELPGSPQVRGLSCGPDGHRFAVSAVGGVARIFDLRSEAAGEVASLATEPPVSGHWLPDGSLLVTHRDGALRRYDSSSGAVLAEARSLDPQLLFWTAVSPHGDVVAAAVSRPVEGVRPTVSLLDSGTLSPLRTMDAAGAPLAFSADGRLLLVGSEGAVVVDAETGAQVSSLRSPIDGGGYDAGSGVFLADGRHVVVRKPGSTTWRRGPTWAPPVRRTTPSASRSIRRESGWQSPTIPAPSRSGASISYWLRRGPSLRPVEDRRLAAETAPAS
jgi:WD40 repeat protein